MTLIRKSSGRPVPAEIRTRDLSGRERTPYTVYYIEYVTAVSSVWEQVRYHVVWLDAVPVCRQSWLDVGQLYAHLFRLRWRRQVYFQNLLFVSSHHFHCKRCLDAGYIRCFLAWSVCLVVFSSDVDFFSVKSLELNSLALVDLSEFLCKWCILRCLCSIFILIVIIIVIFLPWYFIPKVWDIKQSVWCLERLQWGLENCESVIIIIIIIITLLNGSCKCWYI